MYGVSGATRGIYCNQTVAHFFFYDIYLQLFKEFFSSPPRPPKIHNHVHVGVICLLAVALKHTPSWRNFKMEYETFAVLLLKSAVSAGD